MVQSVHVHVTFKLQRLISQWPLAHINQLVRSVSPGDFPLATSTSPPVIEDTTLKRFNNLPTVHNKEDLTDEMHQQCLGKRKMLRELCKKYNSERTALETFK